MVSEYFILVSYWYDRLAVGGYICGEDYLSWDKIPQDDPKSFRQIRLAIDDFSKSKNLNLYTDPASYFWSMQKL